MSNINLPSEESLFNNIDFQSLVTSEDSVKDVVLLQSYINLYVEDVIKKYEAVSNIILSEIYSETFPTKTFTYLIQIIKAVNYQKVFSELYSPLDIYTKKELLETLQKEIPSDLIYYQITPDTIQEKIIFILIYKNSEEKRKEIIRNTLLALKDSLNDRMEKRFRRLIAVQCQTDAIFSIEEIREALYNKAP